MRHAAIYVAWAALTTGVFAALFAPGFGLVHGGVFAAAGVGLIGLALMRRQAELADR